MKNGPGKVEETCLHHSFYSYVLFFNRSVEKGNRAGDKLRNIFGRGIWLLKLTNGHLCHRAQFMAVAINPFIKNVTNLHLLSFGSRVLYLQIHARRNLSQVLNNVHTHVCRVHWGMLALVALLLKCSIRKLEETPHKNNPKTNKQITFTTHAEVLHPKAGGDSMRTMRTSPKNKQTMIRI